MYIFGHIWWKSKSVYVQIHTNYNFKNILNLFS